MFATKEMMEEMLLDMNSIFLGKVLNVEGNAAKIQPLEMIQDTRGKARKKAVLPAVPICQSARKFVDIAVGGMTASKALPPETGDVVVCACADRDITETRNGNFAVPAEGHHSLSDAIVIGVL